MEIDYGKLLKKFRDCYCMLYDQYDNIPNYREIVAVGDQFISKHKDFVGKFCAFRRDYLTSDREVAAFMLALGSMFD